MIFACPVCREALIQNDRQFVCENGHHFDVAKEGYVNLLLANQKKSSDPGDSKQMLLARRLFLDGGYYQPLVDVIAQCLPQSDDNGVLLDVGCGEGYYTGQMIYPQCYGIDISKNGVRYAAKRYKDVMFAVGSAMNLPVWDNTVDVLINVFAPLDVADAVRVLKSDGMLVKVRPNAQHLFELKQVLYDSPQPHDVSDLLSDGVDHLHHMRSDDATYSMTISESAHIQALLQMTPYYWTASPEQQAHLNTLDKITLTADFRIDVYRCD